MPASNLKPGRVRLLGALPVLMLLCRRVCAALWALTNGLRRQCWRFKFALQAVVKCLTFYHSFE